MAYNFDELINRRTTNSVKWDEAEEGVIPMWVADMDFATAPCIQAAVTQRALHPCYGYVMVPDAYYKSIIDWMQWRHQWTIERDWILYTSGVVPAISAIIKAVTQPGDKVILLTPVYNCFFSSVRNCGCQLEEVPLQTISTPHGLTSAIDFDALEKAAADDKATVLLMCNPHNPTGHIWNREELERVARICRQHHVTVISDEIHCELTHPMRNYVPWGTLPAEIQPSYAVCTSPSKAFNTAGLQNASIICPDPALRRRIDRVINIHEICDVNPFGVEAVIAAYKQGDKWLDDLRSYLWKNYDTALSYLKEQLPSLRIFDLQSTYLMWVDVSAYLKVGETVEELSERLIREQKIWMTAGTVYGKAGEGYIRINIACPRSRMMEGLKRFVEGLKG